MSAPLLVLILSLFASSAGATSQDVLLRRAIEAYQVVPHEPVARSLGAKERLGQALFFDPFVSGPKQITCGTCHVRSLGAGDGIRLAVGLGAKGVGTERLAAKSALIVPRNALPFFNRGSDSFVALFWDGRVQRAPDGRFESPLSTRLPGGFDSLLAIAAVFPLAEPDEMLGRAPRDGRPDLHHAELVGSRVDANDLQARTLAVFENLPKRLLAPEVGEPSATVKRYRELFSAAYPGVRVAEFRIHHVGNALAAYISAAFELQRAPWDRYVKGDSAALSPEQKRGAMLFFGKGRCAVCHSGPQFSDFRFHGLAVPQLRVGRHARHIDYGRAAATSRGEDRFAFRTPPLRNVAETPPYGHNGIFKTLEAVIEHHVNPVPALYRAQREAPEEASHAGRVLGFRSPILAEIGLLSKDDIRLLVQFLKALSSPTVMSDAEALPTDVPSGDRQFVRR
jgi:cytochrome c peroxidase